MSAKQRQNDAANARHPKEETGQPQAEPVEEAGREQAGVEEARTGGGRVLDAEAVSEEVKAAFEAAGGSAEGGEEEALDESAKALAVLEEEVATLRDRLQRAVAETENLRRRAERERQDVAKYASANLARDLVGVTDNLRRALEAVPDEEAENNESLKNLLTGVEMTAREMITIFERHHIKEIEALGKPFDPHHHEALFEVPTDETPSGTVVQVIQTGYMLHDRLLRPARVGVAKGSGGDGKPGGRVDTSA